MIVLVSNGKNYSDHRLYFVEAPDVASVEAVLHPLDPYPSEPGDRLNLNARVIGTCEGLTWFVRGTYRFNTMPLETFAEQAKDYL